MKSNRVLLLQRRGSTTHQQWHCHASTIMPVSLIFFIQSLQSFAASLSVHPIPSAGSHRSRGVSSFPRAIPRPLATSRRWSGIGSPAWLQLAGSIDQRLSSVQLYVNNLTINKQFHLTIFNTTHIRTSNEFIRSQECLQTIKSLLDFWPMTGVVFHIIMDDRTLQRQKSINYQ